MYSNEKHHFSGTRDTHTRIAKSSFFKRDFNDRNA